jgi:exodeoxyribonuclease VII small subunit
VANQQKSATAEPVSFEQALATLEQIVHDLEEGRLGLAESLARYEEGVKLLRQCHGLLEKAERRIELVTGADAAGNPLTEPFDDQATFAGGVDETPGSRRGKTTKKRARGTADEADSNSESASPAMDEPGSLF